MSKSIMRWKFAKKRASQIHKQYTKPRKKKYIEKWSI